MGLIDAARNILAPSFSTDPVAHIVMRRLELCQSRVEVVEVLAKVVVEIRNNQKETMKELDKMCSMSAVPNSIVVEGPVYMDVNQKMEDILIDINRSGPSDIDGKDLFRTNAPPNVLTAAQSYVGHLKEGSCAEEEFVQYVKKEGYRIEAIDELVDLPVYVASNKNF
jgi:hypothetical protein